MGICKRKTFINMRTIKQIREDVETILGREWITYSKGLVEYQTIISKDFPHIDIDFLCTLYDDHRGYQDEIVRDYLNMVREERKFDEENKSSRIPLCFVS